MSTFTPIYTIFNNLAIAYCDGSSLKILVEDNSFGESEADEVQLVEEGTKSDEKVKLEIKK